MSVDTVRKIYSEMGEDKHGNEITMSRTEVIGDLEGDWHYRFENGVLNWMHWDTYIDSLSEKNFNKCLKTTRALIKKYSKTFGKPDVTVLGNSKFIDPFKKRHWGYDVLEARWKNYKGAKISVEFTFMGGKGEYHFLVKVNYFDKDYPYYD